MSTSQLEFTIFMHTAGVSQSMGRVQREVAAGLRGMTQAARDESRRIDAALASIASFRELKRGVIEARAEWVRTQAEATRLGAALSQVDQPTRVMQQEFDRARRAAAAAQTTFQQQSMALNALRTSMAAAGISTIGLTDAQARLRAELAANEARFQAQARSMTRIQDARNTLNLGPRVNTDREILRLQAAYERLRATGNLTGIELSQAHVRMTEGILALRNGTDGWATRLSLVREQLVKLAIAGAGIGLAAREAIAFESAMSDVRKVVDFPTPKAFEEMIESIKGMSREIPISLVGLAKIAEAGGQMGIAAKDIQGFTKVVANMSTAFRMEADEAGTAVGKLMNIFAMTVPQTKSLADAINHLGNNTNAVEKDILEVMNRTGGMARVFGLANTETAALATTFLSMGLGPERAATAINALTRELMNAPNQTEKFKAALLRVGITGEQMASQIKAHPQKALMDLLQTLSRLDSQTKMETLVGLFGDTYSDEIVQVVNNMDKYQEILGLVNKETQFAGSMQREFNERMKTTAAQIQLAKNAFSEAGVNLGSAFLPAIVAASKGIAALAHGVADLVDRFPGLSAGATTTLTAFAGFGALRLAWSLMRAQVIGLVAEMGSLAMASRALLLTPMGAMLAAAGVAAYAFSKATASSVPPLLESAAALGKSRDATAEKIKTLEGLKETLEATVPGEKAHTDAEEKLAAILPGVNTSLDEQGRVLARVGGAAGDNAGKLKEYLDLLKKEDRQTLALQLDVQSRALIAGKKELDSYTEGLRNWYGIGLGKATSGSMGFWLWLNKLTGTYEDNIAKGAEYRRQLGDTETGLSRLLAEARKAGMSVEDLGRAMDGIHADPAAKEQIVTMFRAMTGESASATGKVATLADTFRNFSTAIAGPVAASKKGLVEAIDTTDKQLSKYNQALSEHGAILKVAVDNETNSWKTMAKTTEASFTDATTALDAQFDERKARFEQDAQAFQASMSLETAALVDEGKRQEEAHRFSQEAMIQTTTRMAVEESDAKLAEVGRYTEKALGISQREYQVKLDNAKRLKLDANRIDEDRLQDQRNILERTATAYRQNIDRLIAEEKRHRDAARQLAEERKSFNESISDRIQGISEKGMDPTQVYADRQRRIVLEQTQAEEALRAGNFELARKHAERMISLAERTSDAVSVGDKEVVGSKEAAARAIEQMQKAAQIENEVFKRESDAHANAADSLREKSEASAQVLANMRTAVADVDAALAKGHALLITTNMEAVRTAGAEIDALLEKKQRVVSIRAELQGGATALESVVGDVLKGATDKAQASLDEVSRVFTRFKTEFAGFNPEIKATFDAVSATGAIDGLMAKFQDLNSAVPQLAVHADASQARSEVAGLKEEIDTLPSEKTVTIHYLEKHTSIGSEGKPQAFARGGFLPGWSAVDDVPALLKRGEFVISQNAVRTYGVSLFTALNQMRMDPARIQMFAHGGLVQAMGALQSHRFHMPEIPRFEFGGIVRNLVIPTIPPMVFAGGGSVAPQVTEVMRLDLFMNDRQSTSITAPRDEVRGLVRTLQDMTRGLR